MEPTYHEGDVLLSVSAAPADIAVGDVIVFRVSPEDRTLYKMPSVVAHRVIGVDARDGRLEFTTKGDNAEIDPFAVSSDTVLGKATRNLGRWAWPIIFLTQKSMVLFILLPMGVFGVVLVAAGVWNRRAGSDASDSDSSSIRVTKAPRQSFSMKLREIKEWSDSVLRNTQDPVSEDRALVEEAIAALREGPPGRRSPGIHEIEDELGKTA